MTAAMQYLGEVMTLSRDRRAGQAARRTVRDRAAEVVADPGVLDDVELMAAEAIANAVLHGTGTIRVGVAVLAAPGGNGRRLRVEVRDDGPAGLDADGRHRIDHGRGLAVIDALADGWGLDQTAKATHLWFEVPLN